MSGPSSSPVYTLDSSTSEPRQQCQQHHLSHPDQPLLSQTTKPSLYSTLTRRSDQQFGHGDQRRKNNNSEHEHHDHEESEQYNNRNRDDIDGDESHRVDYSHPHVPSLSLYAVHAFCTFDERIYEFASYFFIMEIFQTTLLPMSIYGFSTTIAGILFSTTIGSLVDTTPRLSAVQSFLFAQKFTTVLGALGFWVLLTWFDPSSSQDMIPIPKPIQDGTTIAQSTIPSESMSLYQGYSTFAFLVLASGVLKLSALGWSISIERDWVVALCQSNSETLTRINVAMKRIDLVCKLVSPLVFAALLTQFGGSHDGAGYCSLAMAVWCMFSFCIELYLVRRIWFTSPVLWQPRSVYFRDVLHRNSKLKYSRRTVVLQEGIEEEQNLFGVRDGSPNSRTEHSRDRPRSLLAGALASFQEYAHHVVFLASLSYAIIYINMMSVSGTMIGYLQWRGFTAGSIALLKGVCTVSELVGTILMPIMTRYVGLVRGGAWSIWLEVATLTPVLFSIYSDRLPIQVMIFAGMALSRIGVWSFDLVITQILQEYIDSSANNAGVINGWHYSMMNLFELAQFILTMIWSNPQQYFIPCSLSFICVVVGAVVYSGYLVRMRGHLFHYQRIASAASSCLAAAGEQEQGSTSCQHGEREGNGEGEIECYNQPGPSRCVHRHRISNDEGSNDNNNDRDMV